MAQDIKVALTLDNKQFNKGIDQSKKKTKQFAKESKAGMSGLTKAFAGLFAAIGVGQIINLSDEFTGLNNRLKAVTGSTEKAADALKLVTQVAADSRASLSATASLYADLIIATKDLGTSQAEIADITRVFGQTLAISGADAGAAAGAIRQFGQALASGVLRGDEFNSIAETNSAFMLQLAKALGKPIGALRDLAKEGALTADVILAATRRMKDDVQSDFDLTAVTVGQSFTALRNATLALFGSIESETGVMKGLADQIQNLAKAISDVDVKGLISVLENLAVVAGALGIVLGAGGLAKHITAVQSGIWAMGGGINSVMKMLPGYTGMLKQVSIMKSVLAGNSASAGAGVLRFGFAFLRILPYLAAFVAGLYLVLEVINQLQRLVTGKDFLAGFRQYVIDGTKSLLGFGKAAEDVKKIVEDLPVIDPNTLVPGSKEHSAYYNLFITEEEADEAISLIKTFAQEVKAAIESAEKAATKTKLTSDLIAELTTRFKAGALDIAVYREAMKTLGEPLINVSDVLQDAVSAVTDFNKEVREGTSDLQTTLDQLSMSELERSLDDIKTDLEELRDDTLEDLQDQLDLLLLDPAPNLTAIAQIEQKMKDVTQATEDAIIKQQDLATEGYNASRTFAQGWKEALQEFIEASEDKASKAKDVFETFTKGVEDAFVNFAKTGKLSFKDLLDSMVEMLIRSQVQKLMGALFNTTAGGKFGDILGSIFGRAQGGPVQGGTPYMVGEKGPELFVPNASGQITPNNKLGGGGTVNNTYITNSISAVDAKSVAQLFAENRKTLLGTVQMAQNEMPYG